MKWSQIGMYHWGFYDESGVMFLSVHNSNPGWEVWGSSLSGERRFFPPRYISKQTAQAAAEKFWPRYQEWLMGRTSLLQEANALQGGSDEMDSGIGTLVEPN